MSSNTFTLGTKSVNRLGYGAMQLAGPGVFGPPRDRHVAITVLREALALCGVVINSGLSTSRPDEPASLEWCGM
ncbi:TPA: hypothetical protein NPC56_001638 [Escherichia coli]|nr:hypothetical protein [Escherichia coli]HCI4833060.1 hypothetical protein [Escherichia coli]